MTSDSKKYFQPDKTSNARLYAVLAIFGLFVVAVSAGFVGGVVDTSVDTTDSSGGEEINYSELYDTSKDGVVGLMVISDGEESGGTGFVYDTNGRIVTNQHVVADASQIQMKYSSGEWIEADVIGVDADSDLAVLEPVREPETAEQLEMVEENPVRGDRVMVLGSPLDLEESVSHGIVSGTDRELRRANGFVIPDIVQTDAPVNPGNSGSPVLDSDGDVVGVVSARQGDNIGFAISPEIVNVIVPQLIESGNVNHSYVGVQTVKNDPIIADANGYSSDYGMVVLDVVEGSPADGVIQGPVEENTIVTDDGVEVPEGGDVIVGVDGTEVRTGQDFSSYLMKETNPGDTITVTVIRDGERQDVELTLGARPE